MTLRIGICEDNQKQAGELKSMAEQALFRRTEYEITCFESGEDVIRAIEKNGFAVDLLLLDITMHEINGLQTAQYIRRHNVDVDIIFVTVSREHVYEGYTYKAFAYILKPVKPDKLEIELNRYLDERDQTPNCMQVAINGVAQTIWLDRVLYFESRARIVTAHMPKEEISFYNKLDNLEGLLKDKGFWRCHQSYLVNSGMIEKKSRESVIIKGISIPVSRKYYELSKQGK